jgi:hypothetical protein
MRTRRSLLDGRRLAGKQLPRHGLGRHLPSKPIRWSAYAAGGGSTRLARAVGTQLSAQLRQSILA